MFLLKLSGTQNIFKNNQYYNILLGKRVCSTIANRPCPNFSKCDRCVVQKMEKEDDGLSVLRGIL